MASAAYAALAVSLVSYVVLAACAVLDDVLAAAVAAEQLHDDVLYTEIHHYPRMTLHSIRNKEPLQSLMLLNNSSLIDSLFYVVNIKFTHVKNRDNINDIIPKR